MDDSWNVTKDGQQNVDEEICIAASLKEDTQRRDEDGANDLDDIALRAVSKADSPEAEGGEETYLPVKGILGNWRVGGG